MTTTIDHTAISEHRDPFDSEADYQAFRKWEAWYMGLRAHLHWAVNEEHGGATALEEFFDTYGLAIEMDAGNPVLIDFLQDEPPEPKGHFPDRHVPMLMERVLKAARMEPVEFPEENLPEVASALRLKAEAFVRLAEKIETGKFTFPKW